MKQEYQNWIDKYNKEKLIVAGLCYTACVLMKKSFPELALIRGYVIDGWGKRRTHWYLKTGFNEIIDPTISQFDYLLVAGNLEYEDYCESTHGPLSVGKCLDCGGMIYNSGETFCSDVCRKSTTEYLNKRVNIEYD